VSEPHTLSEFKAWCKGEGRGGNKAGWHRSALDAIERFLEFKGMQSAKLKESEKHRHVEAD